MKSISVIVSFAMLFTGCYSNTTVTKDALVDRSVEVSFRLHNGTRILSTDYQRVENGYRVVGKLISTEGGNSPGYTRKLGRDFSGIVADEQIKEIVTSEFSATTTVLAVVLGAGVIAGIVYAMGAMGKTGPGGFSLGGGK